MVGSLQDKPHTGLSCEDNPDPPQLAYFSLWQLLPSDYVFIYLLITGSSSAPPTQAHTLEQRQANYAGVPNLAHQLFL